MAQIGGLLDLSLIITFKTSSRLLFRPRTWCQGWDLQLTWVSPAVVTARVLCRLADHFAVLQARMFAYPDAARYRLGANYQQLPSNRAHVQIYSAAGAAEKDFEQPRILWHMIQREESAGDFMNNICPTLLGVRLELQEQVYGMYKRPRGEEMIRVVLMVLVAYFSKVEPELGQAIKEGVEMRAKESH